MDLHKTCDEAVFQKSFLYEGPTPVAPVQQTLKIRFLIFILRFSGDMRVQNSGPFSVFSDAKRKLFLQIYTCMRSHLQAPREVQRVGCNSQDIKRSRHDYNTWAEPGGGWKGVKTRD